MLFRFPRRWPASLVLAALALGAAGCTSTTTETTTDDSSYSSIALSLHPSEFLGDTPCSAAPGAMRSYVATLTDRTDPDVPFTHPSSLPTPCSLGIRFDNVAAGRSYSVEIDGYGEFADELGPEGWSAASGAGYAINYKALRSGGRHMHDQDGAAVEPRWLGACGEGDQPKTIAAATGTTLISGCDVLVDTAPGSTEAAVEVAPQDSLGPLHCTGDAAVGEVAVYSFDLLPQNGLPSLLGIPCQAAPTVVPYTGSTVVPGATLDFFIDAHATKDGPVLWGAACSALVEDGLTVHAACSTLSDRGSLHIDISALLELFGVECSGDITSYDAKLVAGETTLSQSGVACNQDVSFGQLTPGDYQADVVIHAKDGSAIFNAACKAAVQPGRAASADCTLQ